MDQNLISQALDLTINPKTNDDIKKGEELLEKVKNFI
jgi:hypothetical protein